MRKPSYYDLLMLVVNVVMIPPRARRPRRPTPTAVDPARHRPRDLGWDFLPRRLCRRAAMPSREAWPPIPCAATSWCLPPWARRARPRQVAARRLLPAPKDASRARPMLYMTSTFRWLDPGPSLLQCCEERPWDRPSAAAVPARVMAPRASIRLTVSDQATDMEARLAALGSMLAAASWSRRAPVL
jgi:hypothetical protein